MDRRHRAELLGTRATVLESRGMEARDDGGNSINFRGYASSTDHDYDMGWYVESVARNAFDKTLRENPDVVFVGNHGEGGHGLPLAGTRNKTLTLNVDNTGLSYDATVDPTGDDYARLAARKVNQGLINQSSFAFRVARQEWNDDHTHRQILEVNLHRGDVTFANNGANENTPVSATIRSLRALLMLDEETEGELRAVFSPRELAEAHRALGMMIEPSSTDRFAATLDALRAAGATAGQMDALANILNLIDASDTNVDKALIALSGFMGVTNPDVAQDAALDRSHHLGLYQARAFALASAAR